MYNRWCGPMGGGGGRGSLTNLTGRQSGSADDVYDDDDDDDDSGKAIFLGNFLQFCFPSSISLGYGGTLTFTRRCWLGGC